MSEGIHIHNNVRSSLDFTCSSWVKELNSNISNNNIIRLKTFWLTLKFTLIDLFSHVSNCETQTQRLFIEFISQVQLNQK